MVQAKSTGFLCRIHSRRQIGKAESLGLNRS
jgi:hypothetical protein